MKPELRVLAPTPIELAMMVLSVVAVAVVLALQFAPVNHDERELLLLIDNGVCVIFLTRFTVGLVRAKQKWAFFKTHWIDLISSIPVIDVLRYGRLFQVIRVLRILRMANQVIQQLMKESTNVVLATMLVILVLVIGGSSIAILMAEAANPHSNIHSAEDAIWWSLVTISTVGYGDYYPVTTAGRVISAVLIISGVSLFGGLTGLMAAKLTRRSETEELNHREIRHKLEQLEGDIKALSTQLGVLSADIRAKIPADSAPTDATDPSPPPKTDACD